MEHAALNGANLCGCDLRSTSLSGADLQGADLRKTNAESASFRGSNLTGVLLEGACLDDADLSETILDLGYGIVNLASLGVVTNKPKPVEIGAPVEPTPNWRREHMPPGELLETDRDTGGGRKIEALPSGMEDDIDPSESYHE